MNVRARRAAVGSLVISLLGGAMAVAASAAGWSDRIFGAGIAVALAGIGFALVAWSKSLDIAEVTQQRDRLPMSDAERSALRHEIDLTERTVGRRGIVKWLFGGSVATLLVGALSPILSLGPSPKGQLRRTSWSPGRRLVTSDGTPIEATRIRYDQLVTVFPEGHTAADDSQVVLIRVHPELVTAETAEAGAVDGWIAYSKICTHLGCSVGLFGVDPRDPQKLRQLVCPCHQSVFDPLDGAKPIGGPAPRALPQLPLAVDAEGFLVARRDFTEPVGPTTWNDR